jgi:glycosyltransferase involved in cell wall biosynthesis
VPPVLSIVLPARDEAAGIQSTVTAVDTFLAGLGLSYEIIVGDSGSSDGTGARALAVGLPRVRVVRVDQPGKGLILGHAMMRARGSVIGFLDSDLEISVEYLRPAIAAVLAGSDAAIGSKTLNPALAASRSPFRRMTTGIANRLIRFALGTQLTDHQAGMKVFRRDALRPALQHVRTTGWLWDTELLATMSAAGASVVEIAVETSPNRPSRLTSMRQFLGAGIELVDICARVRLRRWFSLPRPARRANSLLPTG